MLILTVYSILQSNLPDDYRECVSQCQFETAYQESDFLPNDHVHGITQIYLNQLKNTCERSRRNVSEHRAFNQCAVECAYICQYHELQSGKRTHLNRDFFQASASSVIKESWMLSPLYMPGLGWLESSNS
jgi:hypothetical protein